MLFRIFGIVLVLGLGGLVRAQCPLGFPFIVGICANSPGIISATPGYPIYEWSSGETTSIINPTVPGVYTVTVTIPNNCTASASATVTAFNASWELLPNNNGCTGGTYAFLVTVSDPPDVLWGASIQVGNGPVQTFFNLVAGNTTLQIEVDIFAPTTVTLLQVSDAGGGGCLAFLNGPTSFDIDIIETPDITGNLNICGNETSLLSVNPVYDSYLWSTGENTQSILVSAGGTYSVTVSDGGNCTAVAEVAVIQAPLPTVAFAAQPSCSSGCQMVDLSFTGAGPFTLTYQVTTPDGTQQIITQTFGNNTASIEVCPPPGVTGAMNISALELTDASCLCN